MVGEPGGDRLGFMHSVIIDPHIQSSVLRGRIGRLQRLQKFAQSGVGCACPETMPQMSCAQVEPSRQRVLLMLPWGRDLTLRAFGHPGCPHLREEVDSEFVGNNEGLPRLEVCENPAETCASFQTVRD